MTVIRRKECPVHGANYGIPTPSESFYGKEWCQRCRMPASELVQVEYVPADQLAGAVEAECSRIAALIRERRDKCIVNDRPWRVLDDLLGAVGP